MHIGQQHPYIIPSTISFKVEKSMPFQENMQEALDKKHGLSSKSNEILSNCSQIRCRDSGHV